MEHLDLALVDGLLVVVEADLDLLEHLVVPVVVALVVQELLELMEPLTLVVAAVAVRMASALDMVVVVQVDMLKLSWLR
jgi:hypothetical protein